MTVVFHDRLRKLPETTNEYYYMAAVLNLLLTYQMDDYFSMAESTLPMDSDNLSLIIFAYGL